MQPTDLYVSEKLMEWQLHELESEAREHWKWKAVKKRKVSVLLTSLFFWL
ncbi:hypothetical protein [Paenibacillus roseipurpureus]|uniref:Uncharacterized protein n=1 Tax=Paenibacillus roseopurpureus TaxID=2918901 RepID=A0AA96LNU0_9BACL|nr:hypothetical protein [Paenibacillus sp. MBLB1832]WNR43254.1 hypothetical protein MJB10_19365 [Paenibacillus sp. MBLB1832]